MAFPTIKAPTNIKRTPVDNTLRSPTDAGYVHARPRTTRVLYDFEVTMILSAADLASLQSHDDSVTGATIFSWYCHRYDATYNVRFTKRVSSTASTDKPGWFDVTFSVQSV